MPRLSSTSMEVFPPGVKAMSMVSASEMVWKMVRSSWKPSGRFASTRRSRLILASARSRARLRIGPLTVWPAWTAARLPPKMERSTAFAMA